MNVLWHDRPADRHYRTGTLSFEPAELAHLSWPLIEIRGAAQGPKLCVMAGVHINEASSIEAAVTLAAHVDPDRLRGTISILPIVNVPQLFRFTLAEEPGAGNDLHWSYPGRPDGRFEEILAHALLFDWAKDATVLLDLHGGDLDERMARYVVVQDTGDEAFDRQAAELASCFDTDFVVALEPAAMANPGRCCTGLARFRRHALVAEAGDQGTTEQRAVDWHRNGILNIARYLNMLDDAAERQDSQLYLDRYEWITAPCDGIVDRAFSPGQWVEAGDRIGTMRDLYDRELSAIAAPASGYVMMQKTTQLASAGYWIGSIAVPRSTA